MSKHFGDTRLCSNSVVSAPSILHTIGTGGIRKNTVENFFKRLAGSEIFHPLRKLSSGEVFVFGGAVRRAASSAKPLGDLDVLVHNSNTSAIDALFSSGASHWYNRQGHHRFTTRNEQIDIFRPAEFYHGFDSVKSTLMFFDFRISSLAVCVDSGALIDPYDVLSRYPFIDPEINWPRWEQMSSIELGVLAIRFVKIMREIPELRLSKDDTDRLVDQVRPIIEDRSLDDFWRKYPAGQARFLSTFDRTLTERSAYYSKTSILACRRYSESL